ncbi:MAG TPA: hypothetical protein EYN66_18175 [Myxococcales bacterium]|nr:hypothetical protein [Myxococcales bacterium]
MGDMLPPLLLQLKTLGHKVFDGPGAYDLNIIGIRSANPQPNKFDDLLCCAYREHVNGPFVIKYWPATTDPGTFCLENPEVYGTEAGTAIVAEGQYRGAYKLDLHRGSYTALCQRSGPIDIYRDGNRDDKVDMEPGSLQRGVFVGCNIHKAGENSTNVDNWSAGCQVFKKSSDFAELILLCRKQISHHPDWAATFTYTLIKEW